LTNPLKRCKIELCWKEIINKKYVMRYKIEYKKEMGLR